MNANRDLFALFNSFSLRRVNYANFLFNTGKFGNNNNSASPLNDKTSGQNRYLTPLAMDGAASNSTNKISPVSSLFKSPKARPVSEPVTYTRPQEISPENNSGTAPASSNQNQPDVKSYDYRMLNLVQLNMKFSLADFERMVTELAADAEDGQLETTTFNNLSMGLHVDLDVRAMVEERVQYENAEGLDSSSMNRNASFGINEKYARAIQAQSRQFKADMFYRESMSKNFHLNKSYSDGFLRVSRKMAMRYSQDFAFNYSSLQSYNSQAEALASSGNTEQYLNTTETMLDNQNVGGEVLNDFFGMVDDYLGQAEDSLLTKIDDFFNELSSQLGINSEYISETKELLVSSVNRFFNTVNLAVDGVQNKYISDQNIAPEQLEPVENNLETETEQVPV